MKKRFFLSLIAAIVITLSASAQNNNSYSMILTLANGTTVAIGPNELLNIAFNNGEVNFSGESIESLMKVIEANKEYIDKNSYEIEELEKKTYDLEYQLNARIKDLEAQIDNIVVHGGGSGDGVSEEALRNILADYAKIVDLAELQKAIETVKSSMPDLSSYAMKTDLAELANSQAAIEAKMQDLQDKLLAMYDELVARQDASTAPFKAQIEDLIARSDYLETKQKKETDMLQAQVDNLAYRNNALEEQVAKTSAYNDMLEKRITALEEMVSRLSTSGQ